MTKLDELTSKVEEYNPKVEHLLQKVYLRQGNGHEKSDNPSVSFTTALRLLAYSNCDTSIELSQLE